MLDLATRIWKVGRSTDLSHAVCSVHGKASKCYSVEGLEGKKCLHGRKVGYAFAQCSSHKF